MDGAVGGKIEGSETGGAWVGTELGCWGRKGRWEAGGCGPAGEGREGRETGGAWVWMGVGRAWVWTALWKEGRGRDTGERDGMCMGVDGAGAGKGRETGSA